MEKVSYFQIWGTYLPPKSPKKVLRNMKMVSERPASGGVIGNNPVPRPATTFPSIRIGSGQVYGFIGVRRNFGGSWGMVDPAILAAF